MTDDPQCALATIALSSWNGDCTSSQISLRRMNQGVNGGSYRDSVGSPAHATCAARSSAWSLPKRRHIAAR